MADMMRAMVTLHPGGPQEMHLEERPVPEVIPGWTLVHVRVTGLNLEDLHTRQGGSLGVTFPLVQGIECAGEVVESSDPQLRSGQKVVANMGGMGQAFDGSYSEFVLLPNAIVTPVTTDLSWPELGALPQMSATAWRALHKVLEIQPGQSILVRGGNSSVGLFSVQLARAAGLHVVASMSPDSPNKSRLQLLNAGAHEVLPDSGHFSEHGREFDAVLELTGGRVLHDSLQCLKRGATCCLYAPLWTDLNRGGVDPISLVKVGTSLVHFQCAPISSVEMNQIIGLVERKQVSPLISQTFTLAEIPQAHDMMEKGCTDGKMVVVF